jgi:lipid-A-disaccharide synthase
VEAARLVQRKHPELDVLIARPEHLEPALYEESGLPTCTADDVLRVARAAITKSGTITLELALAGVPMVVGYRTSRVTYAAARRVLRIDTIVLANLVTGERFVPELIQDEVTPGALAGATLPLLDGDSAERARMTAGLSRVRASLGEPGCARRVAEEACALLAAAC